MRYSCGLLCVLLKWVLNRYSGRGGLFKSVWGGFEGEEIIVWKSSKNIVVVRNKKKRRERGKRRNILEK